MSLWASQLCGMQTQSGEATGCRYRGSGEGHPPPVHDLPRATILQISFYVTSLKRSASNSGLQTRVCCRHLGGVDQTAIRPSQSSSSPMEGFPPLWNLKAILDRSRKDFTGTGLSPSIRIHFSPAPGGTHWPSWNSAGLPDQAPGGHGADARGTLPQRAARAPG